MAALRCGSYLPGTASAAPPAARGEGPAASAHLCKPPTAALCRLRTSPGPSLFISAPSPLRAARARSPLLPSKPSRRVGLRAGGARASTQEQALPRRDEGPDHRRRAAASLVAAARALDAAVALVSKAMEASVAFLLRSPAAGTAAFGPQGSGRAVLLCASPLFFAAMGQTARAVEAPSINTPLTVVAAGMSKWLELYSGLLLCRVLLSWFPNIPWDRQPLQAMRDMCDPYLNLFRNILPPVFGALDLSPLLAFMVLGILSNILHGA